MSMQNLLEMSRRYGADPAYVLAGGGNTSVKDGGVMHVKASGTALATITEEQFVAMDVAKLTAMLGKAYPAEDAARERAALADMMAARLPGEEAKRPSVEAILHALFPHRYVLHVHPALVNGMTCGRDGEAACARLFPDAVWIPLTKPGYILATVCRRAFEAVREASGAFPQVVFMQNHGVFVAADSVEEIDARMAGIMGTLQAEVNEKAIASLTAPFTPDHIVYRGHMSLFLDSMKIAAYAEAFGGPLLLPDDFVHFILNWEVESYRQKVGG